MVTQFHNSLSELINLNTPAIIDTNYLYIITNLKYLTSKFGSNYLYFFLARLENQNYFFETQTTKKYEQKKKNERFIFLGIRNMKKWINFFEMNFFSSFLKTIYIIRIFLIPRKEFYFMWEINFFNLLNFFCF